MLSKRVIWALLGVSLLGIGLRLIWLGDMEYKTDEAWMFQRAVSVGKSEPWPWLGVASGVYLQNPGMSVWVFVALTHLFGVSTPVELARAVAFMNILGLGLLLWFALRRLKKQEGEIWLWAFALACVNPFAVLYHRKIWAQSVLPFFSMLYLISWSRRQTFLGALLWGLVGGCLGQIHMAGFFFAAAVAAWSFILDRKSVRWGAWFLGSCFAALPLIPWFFHVYQYLLAGKGGHPVTFGWSEAIQLKFWVFWLSNPLGIHLGNALGVLEGNGAFNQMRDFLRYPLVYRHPTYMMFVAHLLVGLIALRMFIGFLRHFRPRSEKPASETRLVLGAVGIGFGVFMTVATLAIHRYYLLVTFPLEFVWLAYAAFGMDPAHARKLLTALILAEFAISATFLIYIHQNGGAPRGDYGTAYRLQKAR